MILLSQYYQNHIKNHIKYLDKNSEEYSIYTQFMKGYFSRNKIIWKYNTELMRDNKKFFIFALLNLLKFK
jgi:rhamnosyltransferase